MSVEDLAEKNIREYFNRQEIEARLKKEREAEAAAAAAPKADAKGAKSDKGASPAAPGKK